MENLSSRCSWQDLKVHVQTNFFFPQVNCSESSDQDRLHHFIFKTDQCQRVFVFRVLQDFMRQAGEVTYADAHKERTNEGVIEFRSHSDMKRALDKLDGTDINGRKIRLVEDRPRRRRSYSGSRSRWELYNASDWMLCEKSILNSDFNCIANKLAALMQFLTLLSSDLVVAVAPAAGAAGATEAGAPGVVPDPTPGENGSNLHQKYRCVPVKVLL